MAEVDFITEKCNSVKTYSKAVISFYDSKGNHVREESIIVFNPMIDFDQDRIQLSLGGNPDKDGNVMQFGQIPKEYNQRKQRNENS